MHTKSEIEHANMAPHARLLVKSPGCSMTHTAADNVTGTRSVLLRFQLLLWHHMNTWHVLECAQCIVVVTGSVLGDAKPQSHVHVSHVFRT
jgi:hypothetical protein